MSFLHNLNKGRPALLGLFAMPVVALAGSVVSENLPTEETLTALESKTVEPSASGARSEYQLFFGADAGYASLFPSSEVSELSKDGFLIGLKALGSYSAIAKPFVIDFGGGWYYTKLTAKTPLVRERNYLGAGFVEVSPRYLLGANWQAGPYLDLGFGADQSLSQGPNNQKGTVLYGGLQALYQTIDYVHPFRAGFRLGTDITLPDRQLFIGQLSVQFGFGLGNGRAQPQAAGRAAMVPVQDDSLPVNVGASALLDEGEAGLQVKASKDSVEVHLGRQVTNFATGSSRLSPESARFLTRLGTLLVGKADLWKSVEIQGHTDIRGTLPYNMRLSKNRAGSVASALRQGGAPKSKMKSEGFGPKQPVDPANNPTAWAKNRRVEILFQDVKDPAALAEAIADLKKSL